MKRIIRFLARISGVEKDIRFEERHNCARKILGASYWFSDHGKYGPMYPFLYWIAKSIGFQFGITGSARDQYDRLTNERLIKDGAWRSIKFNHIIGWLEITDKPSKNVEHEEDNRN